MGRIYKKKVGARRYKHYTEEQLKTALSAIRARRMSCTEASNIYNIPRRTLFNKLNKKHEKNVGRPVILSEVEERHFVDVLLAAAEFGSPLTQLDLRILIKRFLDKIGRKVLKFPNNLPGKDWSLNFMDRHKHRLTQRICQNIKQARASKSEDEIKAYFDNLERTLENVTPDRILNYDETNLSDNPGSTKCIFKRGTKYPERILNSTKAAISIMFAAAGDGTILAPYVVYKAERLYDLWTVGGPPGTRYNRSKSGWFDAFIFEDWFNTIAIPWARKKEGKKVIIGDNLSSHLNTDILVACARNNISFVFLPPNSTHITQPLDVGYYAPLKRHWRKILTDYKMRNPKESALNKTTFPGLLRKLCDALSISDINNIKNAFRATGIIPLDREQVIKRLPNQTVENLGREIDTALLEYLKEKRGTTNAKKGRKKMLKVVPGMSVSVEDDDVTLEELEIEVEEEYENKENIIENEENVMKKRKNVIENEENVIESEEQSCDVEIMTKPKIEDFVIVKFSTKKTIKHYIGSILNIDDGNYSIKFLRSTNINNDNFTFVFPTVDDIGVMRREDIVKVLRPPIKRRGVHKFDSNLNKFENLC